MKLPLVVVIFAALLPHMSHATFKPLNSYHSYWTAFLNISYLDKENNVWHSERKETGRFGNNALFESGGLAVKMVAEGDHEDNTACTPPFHANYPKENKWIAVIERGKCTFNQKILNALTLNASGVLVYDKKENDGALQSMQVEPFNIPAVFTYRWKGFEILELMENISEVYLSFEKGSQCFSRYQGQFEDESRDSNRKFLYCNSPKSDVEYFTELFQNDDRTLWNWNITSGDFKEETYSVEKRTSVLFVSISFVVLMIISMAWLVFYYVQRFRYIHAKDQLERKLCNQAKRALSIISTNVLKKDDLEMKDFSETCAVCIETYRVADVVRILPCKHQFHKSCIDQWLLEKRTCPMCKMDILKHYGLVDDGSSSDREDAAMAMAIV